jgi:PAS domain S-box-containing protein
MASLRNGSPEPNGKISAYPVERFATDFSRLITDVNQLMTDLSNVSDKQIAQRKTKGERHKPVLDHTISTLREHARSFVTSAMRYNALYERVPVPYMELDAKARILRTNRECSTLLDPVGKPVLGKPLFNFIPDSDAQRLREHLAICRQTDKPCAFPISIMHKGERLPIEFRIRRHVSGSQTGYVAVVLQSPHSLRSIAVRGDIRKDHPTSFHQFVVELSNAHSFTSVVETVGSYCSRAFTSPAGMIFVERDGQLRLVSQWRSKYVSKRYFSEERVRNGPVTLAFRKGASIFWSQTKSRSEVARYLRRLFPGQRGRSLAFLPISTSGGRTAGVLAMVLLHEGELAADIRDDMSRLGQIVSGSIIRALAYDDAMAARVAAENANHRQAEFLSVISHELRNPMTPILNWAVALSSGSLPAEKQSFATEAIIRNVRALNYLIDDLFDVARISSGKLRLELSEIRIQELAREALTATQQMAESKKLRITTDISEGIPRFLADPRRVRQVLINLLNNAVKFTPGGGSITLRVTRRRGYVECTVADTGKGIDHEFLPFVFDRFRQENRSSKARAAGLGLGLSIVREIVELHGGSVKAHSRGADQGATFVVRLPLRRHRV